MNPIAQFIGFHPFGIVQRIAIRAVCLILMAAPLLIVAVPIAMVVAAQSTPELRRDTEIPKELRPALQRAAQIYHQPLDGAQWSMVHQMKDSDHRLFQLQGKNVRGNKIEIEITSAGRIVEVEEQGIPTAEVPSTVLNALKAKMPRFAPERIEAIYQNENLLPVSYGFEGRDESGREAEIYISADGTTLQN